MPNCKNYRTDGGDTWVINGKLVIAKGAKVEGLPSPALSKLESQTDSTAADVDALKTDFNALLAKLRNAGLMD